jgi:hypothetical protein
MAILSQSQRTVALTGPAAIYGIYPTTTIRAAVLEVSTISTASANSYAIGLGRPATPGTPSADVRFVHDDPSEPASPVTGHVQWAIPPTSPLVFHRRWSILNTAGFGNVYTFPRGLIASGFAPLVLWSPSAILTPADVNVVMDV